MGPRDNPNRSLGEGYTYVAVGITFAVGILAFVLGGLLLDRWLHVLPLFTITGTLVGLAVCLVWVWAKLQAGRDGD